MQTLRIGELLRYALAGGLGLVAFWLTYPSAARIFPNLTGVAETSLLIGLVLLAGSLPYSASQPKRQDP